MCWGYNGDGRRDLPASIANRHDYTDVDCQDKNCCALNGHGEVDCFGLDLFSSPPIGSGYTELVYHENGGCVLTATGQPNCWGENVLSELPPVYEP